MTVRLLEPARTWQADPYAEALRAGQGPLFLRRGDGWLLPLDVERWCAEPDIADDSVLDRCRGPVLDVGCGPGRLVAALARRGHTALGVDVTPAAVERTVRAGGSALCRSVFDPLPREGRWGRCCSSTATSGSAATPRPCCVARPNSRLPTGPCSSRWSAPTWTNASRSTSTTDTAGGGALPVGQARYPRPVRGGGGCGLEPGGHLAVGGPALRAPGPLTAPTGQPPSGRNVLAAGGRLRCVQCRRAVRRRAARVPVYRRVSTVIAAMVSSQLRR